MSAEFHQLLVATIQHLEGLMAQGTQFIEVSPDTLAALAKPTAPIQKGPAPRAVIRPATAPPSPAPPAAFAGPPTRRAEPAASEQSTVLDRRTSPSVFPSKPDLSGELSSALAAPAGEAKAQAMAELRERALVCMKCPPLAAARKNVVFGVGNIHSPLLFVGEAPGADEDAQGEPFVGAAGQLLTKIIQAMGLTREAVYIANILKCRPDTPGQTTGNRKPTPEEMNTCLPYLLAQIDLIQPQVIVALGGTAVEGLLGKGAGITRLRGQWQTYRDIPLMPTFHPSYLLRPENVSKKRLVWEDVLQVMEKLGLPISEKQRGYFLKS